MRDKDSWFRRLAAWALGEIGDSRAVECLIEALEDEDWSVRWHVIWALVKIGDPAVVPLIKALGDENRNVRWAAAWTVNGQLK